jgi:hypothetical protein
VFSQPEAIIEENSLTGDLEVYEATPFGFPDTLRGPTYVIERDSLSGLGRHEHEHDHPEDESLRRHSFDHNDGEECDGDDEE